MNMKQIFSKDTCTRIKNAIIFPWKYRRQYLWLYIILLLSYSAIIRANYLYLDDQMRVFNGMRGWKDFSRFTSQYLSVILHTGTYLFDISPLTLFIAISLLALAGLLLIIYFKPGKEITVWDIISVLPLGLYPYFLECVSYRFDSPYMALSVLGSIIPILFWDCGIAVYCAASFLGILIMCTTYQASSGIYPMLVTALCIVYWNRGKKIKELLRFLLASAASYGFAIIFFRLFIMIETAPDNYINNSVISPLEIFSKGIPNLVEYYRQMLTEYRILWLILMGVILFLFVTLQIINSKQNKLHSILLTMAAIVCLCCMAFGLYPLLEGPLFEPRSMYGPGILLAILALNISNSGRYAPRAACVALSWCFIVFSFTYGNALSMQKQYTDFRTQMVISDLDDLEIMKQDTDIHFTVLGDIGYAPALLRIPDRPAGLLHRLLYKTFAEDWLWSVYSLENYYAIPKFHHDFHPEITPGSLPVLKDSIYHTIRGEDDVIVIELK